MGVISVFKTTTSANSPLDASSGTETKPPVSEFLTVQAFTNFAAMTVAITAAWYALQSLWPVLAAIWVPYALATIWAVISILISIDGLSETKNGKPKLGVIVRAIFVALINGLVLGGAVVGTGIATNPTP